MKGQRVAAGHCVSKKKKRKKEGRGKEGKKVETRAGG
jgi:hypothetical protein